jgi:ribosomal protein S18 acetylase RimI-like enzyme
MTNAIRNATPSDLPELARLFDAYRVFYGKPSDKAAARAFLKARMDGGESHVLVAEDGQGGLAGFTQLYPLFSSVAMKPVLILNDLFVDDNHRRNGIAHQLLDAAVTHARKQGAIRLVLETGVNNTQARALYEKAGWRLIDEVVFYDIETDKT